MIWVTLSQANGWKMENLPSKAAWVGLAAGVAAYDILCPEGETMSEQYDRWLDNPRAKYLAIGAVAVTAAHLLNVIPEQYDPFTRLTALKGQKS